MSEVIQHKHEQKESKSCNIDIKIKLKIKETTKCKAKMLITGLSIPLHPILIPPPPPRYPKIQRSYETFQSGNGAKPGNSYLRARRANGARGKWG